MLLTQEIGLTETMCFLLSLLNVLACGMTSMLHTCLSINRWMAVAFPITYRNINLNIPHKLTVIGIIVIALLPWVFFSLSWIFKQIDVYFDAYIPYCLDKAGELGGAGEVIAMFYLYNHNALSCRSPSEHLRHLENLYDAGHNQD